MDTLRGAFSVVDDDDDDDDDMNVDDGDIELGSVVVAQSEPESADEETEFTPPVKEVVRRAPLIALCFALFANSYALMNPVPYAGFMVIRFHVASDEKSAGYFAGLIMTAFMLGRFLSSFYCGRLSDRISRKFVIRTSLWSCVIFQLAFGLCRTYPTALAARLLLGFFNGIAGVAKAALPELVPKDEQQTAMGYVTNMWSLGMVAGPAVGGILAERQKKWPYLLPNLIGSCLALVSLAGVELWLPGRRRKTYARLDTNDEEEVVVVKKTTAPPGEEVVPAEDATYCRAIPEASRWPVGIYCVFSFIGIAYDESYPLWLLAPRSSGGLAMKSDSIGIVMAVTACGTFVLMFVVFPLISKRLDSAQLFKLSCTVVGFAVFLPPAIAAASTRLDRRVLAGCDAPGFLTWALLLPHNLLYRFALSCSYTALFVCINDSADAAVRGAVNGIAMSVASAFKAAGPSMGAAAFAWSLNNNLPPPFDHRFLFLCLGAASLLSALLAKYTLVPAAVRVPPPPKSQGR
ncbi:hypothetical protein CTAYLR_009112 [Chrysophaeum taylorii]|uniref:Major facilitator superfamily (MFS) profile domain-containing protein n=1 Tax=Chrysophaeum taylorii TaxID=2483200 RepID=A0AAD7UKB4_9STRA|nr:hypothetical protein CTAYLR_009112 [Chrysophaeum taylorii]